jgi:hypothetical protein
MTTAQMALPFEGVSLPGDPRALTILAKSIYRELRANGYGEPDVMAIAGELLDMVTSDVQSRRYPTLSDHDQDS